MLEVGQLQAETIGRLGLPTLWIFMEHVEFRGLGILDCKMFSLRRQFAGANGLTDDIGNVFVLRLCRVLINLMVKTP